MEMILMATLVVSIASYYALTLSRYSYTWTPSLSDFKGILGGIQLY